MDKISTVLLLVVGGATAVVVALTKLIAAYVSLRKQFEEMRRSTYRIVGVFGKVPDLLSTYKDYWNLRDLKRGVGDIRILHLRNLSYGLRKCEWVIADHDDGKIINYEDTDRIRKLILDVEIVDERDIEDAESKTNSVRDNRRDGRTSSRKVSSEDRR